MLSTVLIGYSFEKFLIQKQYSNAIHGYYIGIEINQTI